MDYGHPDGHFTYPYAQFGSVQVKEYTRIFNQCDSWVQAQLYSDCTHLPCLS